MAKSVKEKEQTCSFCGRERKEVLVLVQGDEVAICESCAMQANKIIEEELGRKRNFPFRKILIQDVLKNF